MLAADKTEEAVKIIRKAAKINGRTVPEDVLTGEQKAGGMHIHELGEVRRKKRKGTLQGGSQPYFY